MIKKYIVALVASVAFTSIGVQAQTKDSLNSVKVGGLLPLTGEFASLGEELRRGMELGVRDFPEIKVVYEDHETFVASMALSGLNKLVEQDHVQAVLLSAVNIAKPLAPVLNRKNVPGIVMWDGNELLAKLGKYVFGMGFSTEAAGKEMAKFAVEKLGAKTVSIIYAHDEWSELISKSFAEEFVARGGEVQLNEGIALTTTDLKSLITRVKAHNSAALYAPLFSLALTSVLRQSRELGYLGHLMVGDGFTDNELTTLGKEIEGVYVTQVWLKNDQFRKKYVDAFGSKLNPLSLPYAAIGYDGVKLMADTVKELRARGKSVTSESLTEALTWVKSDGFTGVTTFGESKVSAKYEPVLIVKNRELVLAE